MEGVLSMGPTPPSFLSNSFFSRRNHSNSKKSYTLTPATHTFSKQVDNEKDIIYWLNFTLMVKLIERVTPPVHADLRYVEEDSISPSTSMCAALESKLRI